MAAAPDFLQYAPADILKMGQERGLPPEQIAQAVTRHRDNIAAYGQQAHGDAFMQEAMPRLQQDTNAALKELQPSFAMGDTLSGIGEALGSLTTTVPAAYHRFKEGMTRPDQYSPEAKAAFQAERDMNAKAQQEQQTRMERGQGSGVGDTFRTEVAPSLGFSVGSMAAAIPAGMAAGATYGALAGTAVEPGGGTVVGGLGGAVAGAVGAGIAGGAAAYQMAGAQFLDDAFQQIEATRKKQGLPWNEADKQAAYEALKPLAENHALWEAGPEAVGNAATFGLGKVVLGIGKPVLTNLAKTALGKAGVKLGALAADAGTELATETVTQIGQGKPGAQAQAYAQGQPDWQQAQSPYDRPGGTLQALKDVAPATLATSALMLGAGGAVKTASLPFKSNAPLPSPQTATPTPTAPNASAAAQMGAGANTVPSTLSRIAAESVAPEDAIESTGALTPEDLGTFRRSDNETIRQEDNQTGVGQAVSDLSLSPPLPVSLSSPTTASVTKDSGVTADQTAQNTPGAGLSPAAGASLPTPQERSPEAQAYSQALEDARLAEAARLRMIDNKAQGMPVIPDSPTGSRDILDFANENPIYLPPGFSEQRNLPEYENLKEAKLPQYWRQFIASGKRGGNPSTVAQRAFDAGFIAEPTADAYFTALREGIDGRKQYRAQFATRDKALAAEEKQVVDFDKTQTKLAKKPNALEVPFEDVLPGDKMTIDGENAVVKNVEHNEDGYLTNVVIEDGKRFGLMSFDPQNRSGILVDEYKPQAARNQIAASDFAPADTAPASLDSLLTGTESTRPRNVGETARSQNADPLGELMGAKLAGEAEQAQGKMGALLLPKNFTGNAQAGLAAAAAANNRQPSSTTVNNGQLLNSAYAAAARGSSTQMLPIKAVYEQAKAQNPALTPAQFMAEVQAGDAAGTVLLEPFDSPQGVQDAGEFVARNASGVPSTRMMVTAPLRNPSERGSGAAMASNTGAAQNAEPSPGGLSEAGVKLWDSLQKAFNASSLPSLDTEIEWNDPFKEAHQAFFNARYLLNEAAKIGRGQTRVKPEFIGKFVSETVKRAAATLKDAQDKLKTAQVKTGQEEVGQGFRLLHKVTRTPWGSRYYDFDYKGQLWHVRIADHANTADRQGQDDFVVARSRTRTGMDFPQRINIVLSEPSKSDKESLKYAKDAVLKMMGSLKPQPSDAGSYFYLLGQGRNGEVIFDSSSLEEVREGISNYRVDEKSQSRVESGSDMPGRRPTNLATSKTGVLKNSTSSPEVNPESPLASPVELKAAQKANESKLAALGLPTKPGTRIWARGAVGFALKKIAADTSYPATMRAMADLLAKVDLNNLLLKIEGDARLSYAGKYQPLNAGRGEISLNTRVTGRGDTDIVQSLVHELLHHATFRALRSPKNAVQKGAIADLEALRKRALAALSAQEIGRQFDYELSNTDEFIAALFTRADFQTALAGIPADAAPKSLSQRVRSVLDEIFRVLGELVTGKAVQPGSVLEASFSATLRLMGESAATAGGMTNAEGRMTNDGSLLNPSADSIPEGMAETRSQWRSPNQQDNLYEVEPVEVAQAAGVAWLAQTPVETALNAFENAVVPPGMTQARMFYAHGELLKRLAQQLTQGNEVQRMQANNLLVRAGGAWHGKESQEWGRAGKARAVVSNDLQGIAPILAIQNVLVQRAKEVVEKRFDGGGEGVKTKIEKILANADLDISERVERILATVMQSALKPITSIKDAVAALMPGKSQREQMIEDVAQALMVKARGNVVTPERKTALAALAASLKQTLGASVQGDAKKAAASPLGEVLARAFVDQVSESKLFTEAWDAGRQSVFDMFYDMELDKAFHPARMREEQAQARLTQLEAGSTEQQAASVAERAELKRTLAELKAEMQTAKAKADGMTDTFWQQVGKLMPATPTMAYAPGMSKEAINRGFEQAGYTAEIKTGMKQDGTRTLNVQDALRDPQRAMTAVLNVWDAEAQAAGIDPAAWQEGRKLAWQALNETMSEWQKKADERAAKLAQAQKDALMAKDSPALVKLLKHLAGKIAPGMDWTEIFTDLQGTQKARQLAIYDRLMKDERLQGLTQDERIALTNELDKAWMRERRTVFNRELTKAGILGEKNASDRQKVKNAMPKLLRLINLGMFNSEMFREVIAPEYKLRVIDAKTAATLRGLAEAAYAQPEGVLRNRKLGDLLNAMQSATGSTLAELVNNYWTAAVLSGTRTQFDTFAAFTGGLGTNLIQAAGLLARGRGKDAVAAHAAWWRGFNSGFWESLQILAKGDYSMLKRFGADLNKALQGESGFRPLPLGESLWKNGNTFQKYAMAPVMIWTGRLMAAADHINNTATTAGAMAVARALHPEYYGRTSFSEIDQANARAQALREVTGGTAPTTAADKATVSVRVRELLYGSMREAERLEANEIGDMAAFQNDPTGLFGGVYAILKSGLGMGQRLLEGEANDVQANKAYRAIMGLMAGSLHGLTGTRFMRFGFNFGAEITRYVPGTALMDIFSSRKLYGKDTGPMQRELLIGKNVVGLMLGSTLAALFLSNDDDDDKGLQIEGDWSGLTPQQVKERMSAGYERMTIRWRDGDKVRRVSYKQWPTMGLFAVVGGMLDEKRHKPDQWAQHGTTGHLIRGMGTGMLQIKNVSAVRNLVELVGGTRFGGDPSGAMIDDVIKVGTNFAGGFVPTVMKDADVWNDPRNFKAEGWLEELQRATPISRRFVNDGRPQLNLLGEEVKLQRAPWSRGYTSVESSEAGRVLGALLGRGLNLPQPSDAVMVYQNDVKVPLATLGRDKVWQYEKAVGTAYKQWLATEGTALLQMPVKQADKVIEQRAGSIKRQALARVTR